MTSGNDEVFCVYSSDHQRKSNFIFAITLFCKHETLDLSFQMPEAEFQKMHDHNLFTRENRENLIFRIFNRLYFEIFLQKNLYKPVLLRMIQKQVSSLLSIKMLSTFGKISTPKTRI